MDTTLLVKTKKDLKKKAQDLASDLGLTLTDVVNNSLRQFVMNQGITISKIPTEHVDMYKNNKNLLQAYKDSLDEF